MREALLKRRSLGATKDIRSDVEGSLNRTCQFSGRPHGSPNRNLVWMALLPLVFYFGSLIKTRHPRTRFLNHYGIDSRERRLDVNTPIAKSMTPPTVRVHDSCRYRRDGGHGANVQRATKYHRHKAKGLGNHAVVLDRGINNFFFLWSVSGLATAASQCWDQVRDRPNVGSNEDGIEGKESTRKAERGWI